MDLFFNMGRVVICFYFDGRPLRFYLIILPFFGLLVNKEAPIDGTIEASKNCNVSPIEGLLLLAHTLL